MAEYKEKLMEKAKKLERKSIKVGDFVLVPSTYFYNRWETEKVSVRVIEKFSGKLVTIGKINGIDLKWATIPEKEAIKEEDLDDVGYNPFEGLNESKIGRRYYVSIEDLAREFKYTNLSDKTKWDDIKKCMLLESIYRGLPIGAILLKVVDEDNYLYEIIDGQERIQTLIDFTQDKITDGNGLYFSDFTNTSKEKFFELEDDTFVVFALDKDIEDFNVERLKVLWKC